MASVHNSSGGAPNKLTKARSKMVKPILKKLSHSEKNSLDLDRGWEDQQTHAWPDIWEVASAGRSAREVSVTFGAGGDGGSSGGVRKLQHVRSASGTSHISVATTGSGPRGGSFIHPFQQTPRTSTPPLSMSYANSLASFDIPRDYSPTITEDDDGPDSVSFSPLTGPSVSHHLHHHNHFSQSSLRRPSLASQRTSSLTDITSATAQLRVNTSRSTTGTSRLAHGSLATSSYSDLHLNHTLSRLDSPTSSLSGAATGNNTKSNNNDITISTTTSASQIASPTSSSSITPMSPLRSSLEAAGFPRLRSRSEVDTVSRAEHIREARRKFEERERSKEEKYDREQVRKRERRDAKEASRIEREAALQLKRIGGVSGVGGQAGTAGAGAGRVGVGGSTTTAGSAGGGGGKASRKNSGCGVGLQNYANDADPEKQLGFMSCNYDSVHVQNPPEFGPGVEDVQFNQAQPRRVRTAKRKTQGYWHGFIFWLRTKLLRM
ncbi:hypothetical protein QBC33DRAFT_476972, partial [Phialemonium atrogriseum]